MERPGLPKEESQVVATRAVAGLDWEEGGQRKTTEEREREWEVNVRYNNNLEK